MTINTIINSTIPLLNLNDVDNERLQKAINLAINELATNYFFFKTEETKTVNNNEIAISGLAKKPLEILKITKDGIVAEYKKHPTFLKFKENGEVKIEYHYLPKIDYSPDEDVPELDSFIPLGAICYLAASEYYLLSGLFTEAAIFEDKFTKLIQGTKNKQKNIVMKPRPWLL